MADLPIAVPGAGGRTGETLLILGVVGAGAWFLWRRGYFDKPAARASASEPSHKRPASRDPALPAVSTVQAVPNVSPPVTDAQKNTISAFRPTVQPLSSVPSPTGGFTTIFTRVAKPAPVAVPAGSSSSSVMRAPAPAGDPSGVSVTTSALSVKPAPVRPPPAPAPPKLAPTVIPVATPTSVGIVKGGTLKPAVKVSTTVKPRPLTAGFRR